MEHFVSVFDRAFLPQFLAWRSSVVRHIPQSQLWAFCVDSAAAEALLALDFENVKVIDWPLLEDSRYRQVRETRSRGEYCWTLTARSVLSVMDIVSEATCVTYVDADMWLVDSPGQIYSALELSNATVVLSEHGFSPEYDKGNENGRYCVQFMPFVNHGNRQILIDWEQDCLDECSSNASNGNFGDQKYLDSWKRRYGEEVVVLDQPQLLQAPWNMNRFPLSEAVAFHFHSLRLLPKGRIYLGDYPVSRSQFERVYAPYLRDLKAAEMSLSEVGLERIPQMTRPSLIARWKLHRWHKSQRQQVSAVRR